MCSFATNHFLYDLSVLVVPCGLESASPWDTASRMAEGDQKQRKLFVFQLSSPRPQVRVHLSAADKWSHGIEGTAQPVSGNVAPRLLLPNCLTYGQAASVSSGVWMGRVVRKKTLSTCCRQPYSVTPSAQHLLSLVLKTGLLTTSSTL